MIGEFFSRAEERMRTASVRGVLILHAARQSRRRTAAGIIGVIAIVCLCAGAFWMARDDERASTAKGNAAKSAWRYLTVCDACSHRQQMTESPLELLDQRGGLLQCPQCAKFSVSWYRRGSLALPPGGWKVVQP